MKVLVLAALALVASCRGQEEEMPMDIYCGDMNCYQVSPL